MAEIAQASKEQEQGIGQLNLSSVESAQLRDVDKNYWMFKAITRNPEAANTASPEIIKSESYRPERRHAGTPYV